MTLRDYLRVLRERWAIVLCAVLVGLSTASAIVMLRPPDYTAKITMYVSSQATLDPTSAYQGAQLSQERVKSYVELVTSTRVSRVVAAELGLRESPEDVAEKITATSQPDSILIDVATTDRDPVRAAELANAVARTFTTLVADLERPTVANGVPQVAVRVVDPAVVPDAPSSSGPFAVLAMGLFAGLVVGAAGAFGRHLADNTIKSAEQLAEVGGTVLLGKVAHDPAATDNPLAVSFGPSSPRSEAYRQLRTNLQFVDMDNRHKVIAVSSSLPAEGKTTTLCNLAIALAAAGTSVCVVDADLRRPRVADLLDLERSVGLTTVLAGRVDVARAVQPWPRGGFDVLTSGALPPNPSEVLGSRQTAGVLEELRSRYAVVLVDTPPLLPVTDAAVLAPATDGVVLMCRYGETTRDQMRDAVSALGAVSATLLGAIFTMVPTSGPHAHAQYSYYGSGTSSTAKAAVNLTVGDAVASSTSWRPSPSPSPRVRVGDVGTTFEVHATPPDRR